MKKLVILTVLIAILSAALLASLTNGFTNWDLVQALGIKKNVSEELPEQPNTPNELAKPNESEQRIFVYQIEPCEGVITSVSRFWIELGEIELPKDIPITVTVCLGDKSITDTNDPNYYTEKQYIFNYSHDSSDNPYIREFWLSTGYFFPTSDKMDIQRLRWADSGDIENTVLTYIRHTYSGGYIKLEY